MSSDSSHLTRHTTYDTRHTTKNNLEAELLMLDNWHVHNYRGLRIYELSLELAEDTYRLTRGLPESERWGIGQQMNRSAVSIVSNTADGAGRGDDRDFAHFLRIARGSSSELEAQAELGTRLGFFVSAETNEFRDRIERIKSSITKLELRLQRD